MDSLDLLAREDEFKKLNKQLEKKTESLMKEIEHAMQKQDIFSEFSPSLTLSPVHKIKKHSCDSHRPTKPPPLPTQQKKIQKKKTIPQNATDTNVKVENGTQNVNSSETLEDGGKKSKSKNTCNCCANIDKIGEDAEFLYAFVSVNVMEKLLPQSFLKDRPTVESLCKFLSSKVKLMQEQIDRLQSTLDKKATQCDGHLTKLAELETERMTLLSKMNNMKASTSDTKAKNLVLMAKLNEKEKLYTEQRSEADRLSCDVKRYKIKCNSVEAKCAAQQQTIDNLKQQIEICKRSDKEFRDSTRNMSASNQNAISRLEAHIKVLNTRCDRQMALIDNLRRQNVILSTEGALKALEKEYCDFLNQEF